MFLELFSDSAFVPFLLLLFFCFCCFSAFLLLLSSAAFLLLLLSAFCVFVFLLFAFVSALAAVLLSHFFLLICLLCHLSIYLLLCIPRIWCAALPHLRHPRLPRNHSFKVNSPGQKLLTKYASCAS